MYDTTSTAILFAGDGTGEKDDQEVYRRRKRYGDSTRGRMLLHAAVAVP